MDVEPAINFTNSLLLSNNLKTLNNLETILFREAWQARQGRKYQQVADSETYSLGRVKDAASSLWKRLSTLFNEKVTQNNLKSVVERYDFQVSQAELQSQQLAYDAVNTPSCSELQGQYNHFVGREEDIDYLNTLIHPGTVILIKAPGGTGKTKLAKNHIKQLENQGYLKLELSMAKERESITAVESVIQEWLKQDFNEEPGREFGITLGRLRRLLQTRKVCILIDNLEPALDENGKFIQEHRRYAELLRVLADSTVQSVTLITSRESVHEGVDIHIYELPKLTPSAWQEFFSIHKINIDTAVLDKMHKAYGGNALAMQVLRAPIIKYHNSYLAEYWQEHKIADDVLVEVAVDNLIKEQFERLEQLDLEAYKLLCRLGCYRYQDVPTVPNDGLLCLLWDVKEEKQRRRVITSLRDRGLVEFQNGEYFLHPVIRQEAIERLKASEDWEPAHRKAAEFWTKIQFIETVEDALIAFQAFHHYVIINDFEQAGEVISQRRDNQGEKDECLAFAFYRLGLSQQMIYAINVVINNIESLNSVSISNLYRMLGGGYWSIGNLHKAIECNKTSGEIAIQLTNKMIFLESERELWLILKKIEISAFFNVCINLIDLGELEEAFSNCEQSLLVAKETFLHSHVEEANFVLAFLNSYFGNLKAAVLFTEKSPELVIRDDWNIWTKGYHLIFLGLTYKNLKNFERAFAMYEKAILFGEDRQYHQIKAKALSCKAELYREQLNFDAALPHHLNSIELLEQIGAKSDLAEAYYQLALTYQAMGATDNSKENFDKAIYIFDEQIKAPKQVEKVRRAMEGK